MLRVFGFLLLMFVCVSCKREQSGTQVPDASLIGTWQLTEIKDKGTGTILTYPAGTSERIQLTLKADGSYNGKTRVNLFDGGSYNLPANNKIVFGNFGMMTKVAEDPLGTAFLTVLMSCGLQSVSPCTPSTYTISGNTIEIKTALRYELVMQKL